MASEHARVVCRVFGHRWRTHRLFYDGEATPATCERCVRCGAADLVCGLLLLVASSASLRGELREEAVADPDTVSCCGLSRRDGAFWVVLRAF